MTEDLNLDISEVLRYLDANHASRCIVEGEKIVKAKHLVNYGFTKFSANKIDILSHCLQSSALSSDPHTITGTFLINKNDFKIEKFICSCTAGLGEACKHIAATLLLCFKSISDFKELSVTDAKCGWKNKKKSALMPYHPVPIQDFCCVNKPNWYKEKNTVDTDVLDYYRKELLSVCYSALARHERMASETTINIVIDEETSCNKDTGYQTSPKNLSDMFKKALAFQKSPQFLCLSDQVFYEKSVCLKIEEAISLAQKTFSQNNDLWHEERRKRITGSKCYKLFTYSKNKNPDWNKKIESVCNNFTCINTAYGSEMEPLAKAAFVIKYNFTLYETGLIVHPNMSWLGYSPDGIVYKNDEMYLLEIKCPTSGKLNTATDIIKDLAYTTIKSGEYVLKEKHQYYGQVQLGMYLTNISKCKFVIFSSYDNSLVTIDVPFDEKFVNSLINTLHYVYFNHYLPKLSYNLDL